MGKRYRSIREEMRVYLPQGGFVLFKRFRFPPLGEPACTDQAIIDAIESKPTFGKIIKEEIDKDEILINPQAVPPDCEAAHLQAAAKRMMELGINVNPKLLGNGEKEPEAPQLPSKTTVNTSKKSELQALIDKFGWDIEKDQKVDDLRAAIFAEIEESE